MLFVCIVRDEFYLTLAFIFLLCVKVHGEQVPRRECSFSSGKKKV
jgi:hypothetical protein